MNTNNEILANLKDNLPEEILSRSPNTVKEHRSVYGSKKRSIQPSGAFDINKTVIKPLRVKLTDDVAR